MKDPVVSIVMPVWNAVRFLERTLDSVLKQTFDDFEVVCTDDGSTDGSLDILRAYARRDPRIRAIGAQHAGACAALNRCLDEARGQYVAFLDNDDWLHPKALQTAYGAISAVQTDLLFFDWRAVRDDGTAHTPEFPPVPQDLCPQVIGDPVGWSVEERRGFVTRVLLGARLHRRETLKDVRFDPDYTYGDVLFYWKLMAKPGIRVAHLPVPLYFYAERTGSIIHSPLTVKKVQDRVSAIREIDGILLRENPAARGRVQHGLYPAIAWTAFKDARRADRLLPVACRGIEEELAAGRLRWRDFGLRGFNKAFRIYRALAAARREREKEQA